MANNTRAFPMNWVKQEAPNLNVILEQRGMSLRDYFAAKAMQGLLAGLLADRMDVKWQSIAVDAYRQADAMLEARDAAQ